MSALSVNRTLDLGDGYSVLIRIIWPPQRERGQAFFQARHTPSGQEKTESRPFPKPGSGLADYRLLVDFALEWGLLFKAEREADNKEILWANSINRLLDEAILSRGLNRQVLS